MTPHFQCKVNFRLHRFLQNQLILRSDLSSRAAACFRSSSPSSSSFVETVKMGAGVVLAVLVLAPAVSHQNLFFFILISFSSGVPRRAQVPSGTRTSRAAGRSRNSRKDRCLRRNHLGAESLRRRSRIGRHRSRQLNFVSDRSIEREENRQNVMKSMISR